MPLRTLEQFNREKIELYKQLHDNSPKRNGIACPKCGDELADSNPMITLMSNPQQLNIHCPNCKWEGYRIK